MAEEHHTTQANLFDVGVRLKKCKKCGENKPLDQFHLRSDKSRRRDNGLRGTCKICHRASHTLWRRENLDKAKVSNKSGALRRNFGISLREYRLLSDAQNDKCAICGERETMVDRRNKKIRDLAVDHDHETGKIRGLLCVKCNTSLGGFRDDPSILRKAADYVERFSEPIRSDDD